MANFKKRFETRGLLLHLAVILCLLSLWLSVSVSASPSSVKSPLWVGKGNYRILVRVDPMDLGKRTSDEMPARIHLSKADVQARTKEIGKIDVASLQVAQYNPSTGRPMKYGSWAYAQADWERPYRWYDDSIPEDFPEVLDGLSSETGELKFMPTRNWGYFNETLGEWDGGNLAWIHTQHGKSPSYYAIYFNLLPAGKEPDVVPRSGFIGDGTERLEEIGPTTHGLFMGRVETADWNDDGLPDLLMGFGLGGLIWYPNRGTKTDPRYPYPKLIFTTDGRPLDVGFDCVPLVVDWDGDGIRDLLCGTYPNRVVWFRNVGTNATPRLEYKGFILADGKPFALPFDPVPEMPRIYKTDYHPVLAAADWDGDGDLDLLAGGYVTGMIYWFANQGRGRDNLPLLKFQGPIEADGAPIDTSWCAAPVVADFDGDGDLDIISGGMTKEASGGEILSDEGNLLYYYENKGNPKKAQLTRRRPFPVKGKLPYGSAATPRVADLNGDSLLDLVVAESRYIYLALNIGTAKDPLWEFGPPLEGRWNTAPLAWTRLGVMPFQLLDWNHDGHIDLISRFGVRLNEGKGNPQLFGPERDILPEGEQIFHHSPIGDQWSFTHMSDLDGDGELDFLYGDHAGHVYFHRNLGGGSQKHFDTSGLLLKTADGNPIQVGIHPGKWDFDVIQGARTTLATADFDRDGKVDLVMGDTYGKLRYYRNLTGGSNPTFALPELSAQIETRFVPSIADWNGDGWPDVIIGSNHTLIAINSGKSEGPRFLAPQIVKQPGPPLKGGGVLTPIVGSSEWRLVESTESAAIYLPYSAVAQAVDWNEDGDLDLMANADYGYLCWYDRSFLDHGYAPSQIIAIEGLRTSGRPN